jgi:hypothetical protein
VEALPVLCASMAAPVVLVAPLQSAAVWEARAAEEPKQRLAEALEATTWQWLGWMCPLAPTFWPSRAGRRGPPEALQRARRQSS